MENPQEISTAIDTEYDEANWANLLEDPAKILQLPPLNPDRRHIIKLVCAPTDLPDQLQALILCRTALKISCDSGRVGALSTDQLGLLRAIWAGLTSTNKDTPLSSLLSTSFLLDRFMLCGEIVQQLKSDPSIVGLLQSQMLAEDNVLQRKYVYHILRTIRDPEKSPAWQTFFLIYDTLNEKQSHLTLPVLDLMDKTTDLPDAWHWTLLAHSLSCTNNLVVRRIVRIILDSDHDKRTPKGHGERVLQERFLHALNINSFYDREDSNPITAESLKKYFNSPHREMGSLLESVCAINWKSVPFLHLSETLADTLCETEWSDFKPRFAEHALKLPNVFFRYAVLRRLEEPFLVRSKSFDAYFGHMPVLSTSYESQLRDAAVIRSVVALDSSGVDLSTRGFDQWIVDEVSVRGSGIIEKYFPEFCSVFGEKINAITLEVVRTITDMQEHNWMDMLLEEVAEKSLATMGLTQTWYFSCGLSCLVSAVVVRLLSGVDWSKRFVVELIDYELRLALQILMGNVARIPTGDWPNILDICLYEIQSGRDTHLIGSFILLLDALQEHDRSFDTMQRSYYERVITMTPKHPKWMPILTSHPEIWRFVALDSDFMFDALTYGQHFKGDQLIEQKQLLEFNPSPDDAVRTKALKYILDLDVSTEDETFVPLRRRCLAHLELLARKKPRYYANSETHRVKLRLVQVLALITEKDLHGNIGIERMLLEENNQLNVTYIVEIILALTETSDKLVQILRKAFTPNARRSIFMCMYYKSIYDYLEPGTIDMFLSALLVWTMGKDYHTRLFAQIIIVKILEERQKSGPRKQVFRAIEESLYARENEADLDRYLDDFRFRKETNENICNIADILHDIPRITGMCALEIIPVDVLAEWNKGNRTLEEIPVIKHQPKESLVRTEFIELNVGNVQKKIVPLRELFPKIPQDDEQVGVQQPNGGDNSGLVVVASLITRSANLGGLSRTCEIFGAEKLVLESLRHVEHADFQALSMTSEKWLRIAEVKPFHLADYLIEMKRRGYTLIGAEQTANGITINQLQFPKKSVLVLGHEKEGIPANLLSLLDHAVEIPQFGMVRSLNVHVTGALFIWEYAKQHNCLVAKS